MKHVAKQAHITSSKYDKVPEGYNGAVYICPMHPKIRDVEASDCPICGMLTPAVKSVQLNLGDFNYVA